MEGTCTSLPALPGVKSLFAPEGAQRGRQSGGEKASVLLFRFRLFP